MASKVQRESATSHRLRLVYRAWWLRDLLLIFFYRMTPMGLDDQEDARHERLLMACAVKRRRFPVGASPTRQPLQPEATGATMEVTKWLKPSDKRATNWWQRECAGRNASER